MFQRLIVRYGLPVLIKGAFFCSGVICGSYNHDIFFALRNRVYQEVVSEDRCEAVLEKLVQYAEQKDASR